MKVSAVKRRIKRRSERKSRHNKKANLLRSRKQRGRNTVRKVMKGGETQIFQISIHDKDGNQQTNAVTLTFSDKLFKKTKTLLMSVDLNKFKGDVRKLLNKLFTIDGFNRYTTHSRTAFLVGLADEPAREGVTKWAKKYFNSYCNDNDPNINFLDRNNQKVRAEMEALIYETLLPTKKCDIEIELFENNGDITFTVQKYHRMKIGNTQKDCNNYTRIKNEYNYSILDENGNPRVTRIPYITTYENLDLFYPRLEFASANPSLGGIDYFDYEAMSDDSNVTVYKKKDQTFTFTVKGKTIDALKGGLKTITDLKETDMLDFITQDKETQVQKTQEQYKQTPKILKFLEFVDNTKSDEEALNELKEIIKAGEALYKDIDKVSIIVGNLNKPDIGFGSIEVFKDKTNWNEILEKTKTEFLKDYENDDGKKHLLNLDNAVVKLVQLKKLLATKIDFNQNETFVFRIASSLETFLKNKNQLTSNENLKEYEEFYKLLSLVCKIKIGLEQYKTETSSIFENIEAYKLIFPYRKYVIVDRDTRD